ncbi:inositol monophosphatase family protein [Streptomyces sp. NPDC088812]|uniref:inositol monophosphatase family protein n=1 Tax=Streptomyces sp. NPDC088812 TaxID=3365905 RepID=UPI003812D93C
MTQGAPPPAAPADRLLALALRAARAGAAQIVRRAGRSTVVGTKSSATDLVSDADRAGEEAIRRLVTAERPDDGILGEEGAERPSASGLRWVVDPLDGTVNHVYGIPHVAVSIACERAVGDDWQPVIGVVHDITRGETFTAVEGGGAHLDGAALAVNEAATLPQALLATEFSYVSGTRARQAALLAEVLPRARDIRSTGSSALDLCWVAAGRCDGFYEDELSRWDWAAGALIVREAGGTVTTLGTGVLAAGPALHRTLRSLLTTRTRAAPDPHPGPTRPAEAPHLPAGPPHKERP